MVLPQPLIIVGQKFKTSIILQYLVYLLVAGNISLALSVRLLGPALEDIRIQNIKFLTRISLVGAPTSDGLPHLEYFDGIKQLMGWEAWVVDGNGKVISKNEAKPLPLSWEQIKQPSEDSEIASTRLAGKPLESITVVRLIKPSPTFLVFYQSDKGQGTFIIGSYVILLCVWMFWVSLLGMFFVLRWKEKNEPPVPKRSPEAGFSLISAILVLAITAVAMVGLQTMLAISFKGSSHVDFRGQIRSLSDSIKQEVDCDKTFQGINLAATCDSAHAITLKDAKGNPITETVQTGNFTGADNTSVNGAGKLGSWQLRAYCDSTDGNLVIRYARVTDAKANPPVFYHDPLNRRPYDFSDSDTNPLFGNASRQICKGPSSPGGGSSSQRKMGSIVVMWNKVYNNSTDYATVDLTKNPPVIAAFPGTVVVESYSHLSEPFDAAPFTANIAIGYSDVRTKYGNLTSTPIPAWDMPKPGVLGIRLLPNTDNESTGSSIGSMRLIINAFQ